MREPGLQNALQTGLPWSRQCCVATAVRIGFWRWRFPAVAKVGVRLRRGQGIGNGRIFLSAAYLLVHPLLMAPVFTATTRKLTRVWRLLPQTIYSLEFVRGSSFGAKNFVFCERKGRRATPKLVFRVKNSGISQKSCVPRTDINTLRVHGESQCSVRTRAIESERYERVCGGRRRWSQNQHVDHDDNVS